MNVRIHRRAEADLGNGVAFYDQQGQRVGDYFLECIYTDIDSLRLYAGIHRKVLGYHCVISKIFPFAIYYKMKGDTVIVWRVLDARRNPQWIERQVRMRYTEAE